MVTDNAYHIFIHAYIDTILSADRSIYQRKKEVGINPNVNPAHINRSDITGNICDHSASNSYQCCLTIGFQFDQLLNHCINGSLHFKFFTRLSIRSYSIL